jgi:hypothetical protein
MKAEEVVIKPLQVVIKPLQVVIKGVHLQGEQPSAEDEQAFIEAAIKESLEQVRP